MPYVPSKKTDGKSDDRERIDMVVKRLATKIAKQVKTNSDVPELLLNNFKCIGNILIELDIRNGLHISASKEAYNVASTIFEVGGKYKYDGAFLGELNYAMTILIQEVPKELVRMGKASSELRYWLYAKTTSALIKAVHFFNESEDDVPVGIAGVFEDIKDEYKVRVNPAYEIAQIIKSGDCYTTPYFTKPIEVVDNTGKLVGHVYVNVERNDENVKEDVLTVGKIGLTK